MGGRAGVKHSTIIGIPLAIANRKLIPVTLFPYGKEIVDSRTIAVAQRPLDSL